MLDVNSYFEGKVKSIAFQTDTLPATVGVMTKGEYQFSTSNKESMVVISGALRVMLPGETHWQTFTDGQSFDVEANASFKVNAERDTAYLCKYWPIQ